MVAKPAVGDHIPRTAARHPSGAMMELSAWAYRLKLVRFLDRIVVSAGVISACGFCLARAAHGAHRAKSNGSADTVSRSRETSPPQPRHQSHEPVLSSSILANVSAYSARVKPILLARCVRLQCTFTTSAPASKQPAQAASFCGRLMISVMGRSFSILTKRFTAFLLPRPPALRCPRALQRVHRPVLKPQHLRGQRGGRLKVCLVRRGQHHALKQIE